ncbi:MAG: PilZ domain-containing protein [Candidatus Omnitrophica bacterium]|nr:PilZ domain-containing protein [Candidatus Omnitrophota bacterium]
MWQGINQRRFPRGRFKCVVTLMHPSSSAPLSAVTENIGLGGVCVLLERSLDIFSPVTLEISLDENTPPLRVSGTIVWVVRRRELKKGPLFDTGVEFTDLSAEDRTRIEAVIDKANPE